MIVLGIILVILGLVVVTAKFLFWLGLILILVGLALNFGPTDSPTRRRYW